MGSKSWSLQERGEVYHKTGGACAYCGEVLDPFNGWDVEHCTPESQGGSSALDNLLPSCKSCNSAKKTRDVDSYREWLVTSSIELIKQADARLHQPFNIRLVGLEARDEIEAMIDKLVRFLSDCKAELFIDTLEQDDKDQG